MSLRLDVQKADMLGRGKGFFPLTKKGSDVPTAVSIEGRGENKRNAPCKQRHRRSHKQAKIKKAITNTHAHTPRHSCDFRVDYSPGYIAI